MRRLLHPSGHFLVLLLCACAATTHAAPFPFLPQFQTASKFPATTSSQRASNVLRKNYIATSTVYKQENCRTTQTGYRCDIVATSPLANLNETGVAPLPLFKFWRPWRALTAKTSPQWFGGGASGYVPFGQCSIPTTYEPNFATSFQCRASATDVLRGCQLLLGAKGEIVKCNRVADCMEIDPIATCVDTTATTNASERGDALCVRCCCDGFDLANGVLEPLVPVSRSCRANVSAVRYASRSRDALGFRNTMDELRNRPACCTDQRAVCERGADVANAGGGGDGREDVDRLNDFLDDKAKLTPARLFYRSRLGPGYTYKGPRLPTQALSFNANPAESPLNGGWR